jgi:hypothetical protein
VGSQDGRIPYTPCLARRNGANPLPARHRQPLSLPGQSRGATRRAQVIFITAYGWGDRSHDKDGRDLASLLGRTHIAPEIRPQGAWRTGSRRRSQTCELAAPVP